MYICGKCTEENRLEPKPGAWRTSDGVCECCWQRGNLIWVDAIPKDGWRGNGLDPEWLKLVQDRPETESMEEATARFIEDFNKKPGTASP